MSDTLYWVMMTAAGGNAHAEVYVEATCEDEAMNEALALQEIGEVDWKLMDFAGRMFFLGACTWGDGDVEIHFVEERRAAEAHPAAAT